MNAESIYLICFCVGLILSVISFVTGTGHLHFGHFHFGHANVGKMHASHAQGSNISPLNVFCVMAFLCWFGGAGYLLTRYHLFIVPIVLLLSTVAGVAGAAVIFGFLVKVLLPRERTLLPDDTEMRGVLARVSSTLRQDGTGEILFSLNGTRRCAAARAEDGQPISRDTQVLVIRYERGIAWVRTFSDLDELEQPQTPI